MSLHPEPSAARKKKKKKPAHSQPHSFPCPKGKGTTDNAGPVFYKSYKTSFAHRETEKLLLQLQQQELSAMAVPRLEFLLHSCRGQFSSGALPALPEGKTVILVEPDSSGKSHYSVSCD